MESIVRKNGQYLLFHSVFHTTLANNISKKQFKRKHYCSPELFDLIVECTTQEDITSIPDFIDFSVADVFSLGLLILELATLTEETGFYSEKGLNRAMIENKLALMKETYSFHLISLVEAMLSGVGVRVGLPWILHRCKGKTGDRDNEVSEDYSYTEDMADSAIAVEGQNNNVYVIPEDSKEDICSPGRPFNKKLIREGSASEPDKDSFYSNNEDIEEQNKDRNNNSNSPASISNMTKKANTEVQDKNINNSDISVASDGKAEDNCVFHHTHNSKQRGRVSSKQNIEADPVKQFDPAFYSIYKAYSGIPVPSSSTPKSQGNDIDIQDLNSQISFKKPDLIKNPFKTDDSAFSSESPRQQPAFPTLTQKPAQPQLTTTIQPQLTQSTPPEATSLPTQPSPGPVHPTHHIKQPSFGHHPVHHYHNEHFHSHRQPGVTTEVKTVTTTENRVEKKKRREEIETTEVFTDDGWKKPESRLVSEELLVPTGLHITQQAGREHRSHHHHDHNLGGQHHYPHYSTSHEARAHPVLHSNHNAANTVPAAGNPASADWGWEGSPQDDDHGEGEVEGEEFPRDEYRDEDIVIREQHGPNYYEEVDEDPEGLDEEQAEGEEEEYERFNRVRSSEPKDKSSPSDQHEKERNPPAVISTSFHKGDLREDSVREELLNLEEERLRQIGANMMRIGRNNSARDHEVRDSIKYDYVLNNSPGKDQIRVNQSTPTLISTIQNNLFTSTTLTVPADRPLKHTPLSQSTLPPVQEIPQQQTQYDQQPRITILSESPLQSKYLQQPEITIQSRSSTNIQVQQSPTSYPQVTTQSTYPQQLNRLPNNFSDRGLEPYQATPQTVKTSDVRTNYTDNFTTTIPVQLSANSLQTSPSPTPQPVIRQPNFNQSTTTYIRSTQQTITHQPIQNIIQPTFSQPTQTVQTQPPFQTQSTFSYPSNSTNQATVYPPTTQTSLSSPLTNSRVVSVQAYIIRDGVRVPVEDPRNSYTPRNLTPGYQYNTISSTVFPAAATTTTTNATTPVTNATANYDATTNPTSYGPATYGRATYITTNTTANPLSSPPPPAPLPPISNPSPRPAYNLMRLKEQEAILNDIQSDVKWIKENIREKSQRSKEWSGQSGGVVGGLVDGQSGGVGFMGPTAVRTVVPGESRGKSSDSSAGSVERIEAWRDPNFAKITLDQMGSDYDGDDVPEVEILEFDAKEVSPKKSMVDASKKPKNKKKKKKEESEISICQKCIMKQIRRGDSTTKCKKHKMLEKEGVETPKKRSKSKKRVAKNTIASDVANSPSSQRTIVKTLQPIYPQDPSSLLCPKYYPSLLPSPRSLERKLIQEANQQKTKQSILNKLEKARKQHYVDQELARIEQNKMELQRYAEEQLLKFKSKNCDPRACNTRYTESSNCQPNWYNNRSSKKKTSSRKDDEML
jgi:hypothetical protein